MEKCVYCNVNRPITSIGEALRSWTRRNVAGKLLTMASINAPRGLVKKEGVNTLSLSPLFNYLGCYVTVHLPGAFLVLLRNKTI